MPAVKPVAVDDVPPEGLQLYVYVGVPPLATTLALPSLPPKQLTLAELAAEVNKAGSVITAVAVVEQPRRRGAALAGAHPRGRQRA